MIPPFLDNGLLPPGEHEATWSQCSQQLGFSPKRRRLLEGLKKACLQLRNGGITRVFLDGSFVTSKEAPGDYDGCWPGAEMIYRSRVDPVLFDFAYPRERMKGKYGGELFIAEAEANELGQPFRDFFQYDRDGNEKGIVVLILETIR